MVATPGNSVNETTTGVSGFTGTAFTGTAVTQYNVIVGGSTSSTLANVAPSATSGVPLISQGAASNPAFGTAVVGGGGTGATSFNTNGAVISGTSSTAALAAVSLSSQKFLVGNSGAPTAKAFSVVEQVFTGSGTYTPTAGMVYCIIECQGGGGGGGGTATSNASFITSGGGGGGGGYSRIAASAATIGASQTVTIGGAGSAGSAGNNAGGNGGDTSVGAICIGKGGTGGSGCSGGTASTTGGAGGIAGTGDFSRVGESGSGSTVANSSDATILTARGGNSFFGNGGQAVNAQSGNVTGGAGTGYGGGGGGGASVTNGGAQAGAAGTAGIVVITEYVIS